MENDTTQELRQQLEAFLSSQPYEIPRDLTLDGNPHRFGGGKKGREPHWYVGTQENGVLSLTVGSHKDASFKASFRGVKKKPLWSTDSSFEEKWSSCSIHDHSPYLERKKIGDLFGAKFSYFHALVIPMYTSGVLVGLQTIAEDGKKLFVPGSKKKAAFFELQAPDLDQTRIFVCEGFATAASVCLATQARTVCAFDAGNLPLVVEALHQQYPAVSLIIAGDEDLFSSVNAGRQAAGKVAHLAKAVFPTFQTNTDYPTDWNDLHVREGLAEAQRQLNVAFTSEVSEVSKVSEVANLHITHPVSEEAPPALEDRLLIFDKEELENALEAKRDEVLPCLPRKCVGILCSPGGYGKSGVALLIANQIASGGVRDFLGLGPVQGGAAVVLTLEDPVSFYAERQKEIDKDFTEAEKTLICKNLYLIQAQCVQNAVNSDKIAKLIINTFQTKQRDISTLRLLVIDHLSYWSPLDLNDGQHATKIMQDFQSLALKLHCAVLVLHHSNRSAMVQGKDRQSGSAAMGGHYKFHSLARWVAMIEAPEEKRGQKDNTKKTLVVDKTNYGKKFQLELAHNNDRGGLLYKTDFEMLSTVQEHVVDGSMLLTWQEPKTISKHEIETFNMGEASPKLLTLDENTLHIMNWLARNRAFEVVDPQKRARLTYINEHGCEADLDRTEPAFYENVWIEGDVLQVHGPCCDQEDMRLYAILVNELTKSHKDGARGLTLDISLSEILRLAGLELGGTNSNKVHRQLNRLRRMALDFQNTRGHRWQGPLINHVITIGDGRNCKIQIDFNPFMIAFYKLREYTIFQKQEAKPLKGNSLSFYIFYASHSNRSMKISVERCKKLLGIAPDYDKKEAMKKVRKALQDLVDAGVMQSDSTFIKDGNVYTCRATTRPASSNLLLQPTNCDQP